MKSKIKFFCFLLILGTIACQQEDLTNNQETNAEIEVRNTPCSHCDFVDVDIELLETSGNCCLYQVEIDIHETCRQEIYINGVHKNGDPDNIWQGSFTFHIPVCPGDEVSVVVMGANEEDGIFDDVCFSETLTCGDCCFGATLEAVQTNTELKHCCEYEVTATNDTDCVKHLYSNSPHSIVLQPGESVTVTRTICYDESIDLYLGPSAGFGNYCDSITLEGCE